MIVKKDRGIELRPIRLALTRKTVRIGAAAERADTERMAYGAPEGAAGLTAYSYELMGSDGEGGRNLTRGLGAALLLGLGLGVMALRRRFI
jgi:putative membrane protein